MVSPTRGAAPSTFLSRTFLEGWLVCCVNVGSAFDRVHYEILTELEPSALHLLQRSARVARKFAAERGASSMTGDVSNNTRSLLLQVNAARSKKRVKLSDPAPAGWFGSFSQDESSYTYDGTFADRKVNPEISVMDGWNPHTPSSDMFRDNVENAEWFQDLESGGYKQAWQTFYPALQESVPGNRAETGKWFQGAGGTWQQDYKSQTGMSPNQMPASWFDDSVNQVDGFGRSKFPALGSPRFELYWERKSVSSPLTCKVPGCNAQVALLAPFCPNTEQSKDCKLNVKFHPTDFDDLYSGEMISWVQVNGRVVRTGCHPLSHGCNETMWRPLLACVDDAPVDWLIPDSRELHISAQIPDVVDECPYKGNLLSGVATLTCLVSPKVPTPLPAQPVYIPNSIFKLPTTCVQRMPLQCSTRGCSVEVAMTIECKHLHMPTCALSLIVNQTDYDNLDGTIESIEYIKVDGEEVASNLKPGLNPCKWKWHGHPYEASELTYTALKAFDVTKSVSESHQIHIAGKISPYVDECANNGYLFDAMAEVTCTEGS